MAFAGAQTDTTPVSYNPPQNIDPANLGPDFLIDPGPAIQAAAEAHLEAVWDAHYAQVDAGDDDLPTPAVGPFDGCETCVVRETIAGAWPLIEAHFALRSNTTDAPPTSQASAQSTAGG